MWLLNTYTFEFKQVSSPEGISYPILSHVWDRDEAEQTFQDLQRTRAEIIHLDPDAAIPGSDGVLPLCHNSSFSPKIRSFCAVARSNGYRLAWADMCCIDKTSSAELSEAINSMFAWYAAAEICYAYLDDVSHVSEGEGEEQEETGDPSFLEWSFRRSDWFSRGWTLQELIAPYELMFFSSDWTPIGSKNSLAWVVADVTGVDVAILRHEISLDSVSVARRMSWAAERTTTRVEDEAYSLMGIFSIHMTTIYGEGRHAFLRLQEEIYRRSQDQSIFAWGNIISADPCLMGVIRGVQCDVSRADALFATAPAAFLHSRSMSPTPASVTAKLMFQVSVYLGSHAAPVFPSSPLSLLLADIPLPVEGVCSYIPHRFGPLACRDGEGNLVCLLLSPHNRDESLEYHVNEITCNFDHQDVDIRAIAIPISELAEYMLRSSQELVSSNPQAAHWVPIIHPLRYHRSEFKHPSRFQVDNQIDRSRELRTRYTVLIPRETVDHLRAAEITSISWQGNLESQPTLLVIGRMRNPTGATERAHDGGAELQRRAALSIVQCEVTGRTLCNILLETELGRTCPSKGPLYSYLSEDLIQVLHLPQCGCLGAELGQWPRYVRSSVSRRLCVSEDMVLDVMIELPEAYGTCASRMAVFTMKYSKSYNDY